MMTRPTIEQLEELIHSDDYMEYIMLHGDRPISNGHMLLDLAEDGYLWNEFLESINVQLY